MAGVVNIITKRGRGDTAYNVSVESGSHETYRSNALISGGSKKLNYSLAFSKIETEGISAASEDNGNTEKDGYENTTLSGRFGYRINNTLYTDFTLRFVDAKRDLDGGWGLPVDDPDYVQENSSLVASFKVNQAIRDFWNHSIKLSVADEEIKSIDPTNTSRNSKIETSVKTVNWQHNLYLLNEKNTLTLGFEHEKQEGKKPLTITTSAKQHNHPAKIDFFSQGTVWKHDRPVRLRHLRRYQGREAAHTTLADG